MKESNCLIIGKTSQISYYLPNNFVRITARKDIDSEIYEKKWDKVYLFFAEQRTSYAHDKNFKNLFYEVNLNLTKKIVKNLKSNHIIFLSTTELWNNCNSGITVNTPWDFRENYYTDSKRLITEHLYKDERVKIFFPFNYNSIHRKNSFLFYKIYKSIIQQSQIQVGNLNFSRELLHAKFVAKEIMNKKESDIIGSGTPINVRNFVKRLYNLNNLNYYDFVKEENNNIKKRNVFYYNKIVNYSYEERLKQYNDEIQHTVSKRYN